MGKYEIQNLPDSVPAGMNQKTYKVLFEKSKPEYAFINVLKGVAILMIIAVHWNVFCQCPNIILRKISSLGALAPQLFFVAGAFLLWSGFSYRDYDSTFEFYTHKFSRLLPPYFLSLIIATVLFMEDGPHTLSVLSHMFFINVFMPDHMNNIIGVEWYIGDYILFITLVPALKRYCKSLRSVLVFLSLGLLGSYLLSVLYSIGFSSDENPAIALYFNAFAFPVQFPVIMLGTLLVYLRCHYLKCNRRPYLKMASIFLVSIVAGTVLYLATKTLPVPVISIFFIAGCCWCLIMVCSERLSVISTGRIGWNINKVSQPLLGVLHSFGKKSYGIYLFHFIGLRALDKWYVNNNLLDTWQWVVMFIIICIVSYFLGYLLEKVSYSILDGVKKWR